MSGCRASPRLRNEGVALSDLRTKDRPHFRENNPVFSNGGNPMRSLLASLPFVVLLATPAFAEDKVQPGVVIELKDAGICTRQDVVQELLDTGSRSKASERLHDYYRMAVNGVPVCQAVDDARFMVTNVIARSTLDGAAFRFVELKDGEGNTFYSLITDVGTDV